MEHEIFYIFKKFWIPAMVVAEIKATFIYISFYNSPLSLSFLRQNNAQKLCSHKKTIKSFFGAKHRNFVYPFFWDTFSKPKKIKETEEIAVKTEDGNKQSQHQNSKYF